jgi:hypothetical protein
MSFFQSINPTSNFFTDSILSYIFPVSLNYFTDILAYKNIYYPNWNFNISSSDNRIIFSKSSLYELIWVRNIITVIPLCINDTTVYPKELDAIRQYVFKYIRTLYLDNNTSNISNISNTRNTRNTNPTNNIPLFLNSVLPITNYNLVNLISFKLAFYTPYNNVLNYNFEYQTNKTILGTQLTQAMYEAIYKIKTDQYGNLIITNMKTQKTLGATANADLNLQAMIVI